MDASYATDKRVIDDDGRLHVADCTLSLAQVSPYLGREIPGYDTLGLIPEKVYRLYRTPELLKAMAESAAGSIPLTDDHIIVNADSPHQGRVAGSVTNLRAIDNRLVGDLSVWVGDSIDRVQNDSKRELSCAYRYSVRMIPATRDGVLVDGEMLPTDGNALNHVALVAKGRAGPQATVADTGARVMKRPKIFAALSAIFDTIAKPDQLAALDMALDEELDPSAEDALMLKKKKDDEEKAAADARAKHAMGAAGDEAIAAAVTKATEGMVTRDEAQRMATDAANGVIATFRAREAVAPKVGVVNLDTAEAVYRHAMDKCGIDHKALAADSLPATWEAIQKAAPAIAQDKRPDLATVRDLQPSHIRKG
jgi:hypothetical protein